MEDRVVEVVGMLVGDMLDTLLEKEQGALTLLAALGLYCSPEYNPETWKGSFQFLFMFDTVTFF